MKHRPERTCIGCRIAFSKDDVARIVSNPVQAMPGQAPNISGQAPTSSEQAPTLSGQAGIVIDYREKLPGRAAYVCPRSECIKNGINRDQLSRALRLKVNVPSPDEFTRQLADSIKEKIKSLIIMAAKAGMLAAGYSAVHDALEKGRAEMLLYARDISEGTKEKVALPRASFPHAALFSRDEFGSLLNRELIGVIGILDKGFSLALMKEAERLKNLINESE